MPCRPCGESGKGSVPEYPAMPTKPACKDRASHAESDAEDPKNESREEEELASKKKRPPRHVLKYVVVKRWVTGERAVQDEDVIHREFEDLMRELMGLSKQL